ncbi:hypothetical protein [Marinococcus sp. PL1-022]|uniref:hypothetical protein n=1 Tax=Marinococcus sp. PL1-022 TaxID=3095363 RepID=UPI0029C21047|nr:hypothetical protein [Marinococcus sp. PL1-022]MDX6154513.1 hypothetical protein [Marinococcus sp. PL1-022]
MRGRSLRIAQAIMFGAALIIGVMLIVMAGTGDVSSAMLTSGIILIAICVVNGISMAIQTRRKQREMFRP